MKSKGEGDGRKAKIVNIYIYIWSFLILVAWQFSLVDENLFVFFVIFDNLSSLFHYYTYTLS